jgi:hypothetical protein
MGDAFVEQPGVQVVVARHPQPWAEEPLAHRICSSPPDL